jgi:hypothetical protein
VAGHIFQARPMWLYYTRSNITNIVKTKCSDITPERNCLKT